MSSVDPITAVLALGVVGLVVYAAGVERSRDAAASAARTASPVTYLTRPERLA